MNILGFNVPLSLSWGSGWLFWITVAVIGLVVLTVLILIGFLIYMSKVYNRKIIVYENISGQGYKKVFEDRARIVKVGDGGEELMWLLKKRVYRTAYGRKMDDNEYWFAVGQDGYWYNVTMGDLNAKLGMLDIEPIDRDMRYMHVAVRKNIQDRYRKQGFWDKHGQFIMNAVLLCIFLVGIWMIISRIGTIAQSTSETVKIAGELMEMNKQFAGTLNNVCSGSGVISA